MSAPSSDPPYIYVLVRTDLAPVVQAVQAAHATFEAGARFGAPPHTHLVLCGVRDQRALLRAVSTIERAGVKLVTFFEPDNDVGFSAACSAPVMGEKPPALRRLQLLC